jgi:hypothetical protein
VHKTGRAQAVAIRASPTINTIKGATIVPTPGAPVLATPIMNAQKIPSSHCHGARWGIKNRPG